MAYNSNVPAPANLVQDDIAAMRENFQHLDPLAQAVDDLQVVSGLAPVVDDVQAVSGLAPYVQTILDSCIVEMGSNSNGVYVRWENGLQVCFARRTASTVGSVVLSSLWTFPAAFIDANYAVVFGLGERPTIAGDPDPFTKTLWLHAFARGASACELRLLVNDQSSVSGDGASFDAVAVGRWK